VEKYSGQDLLVVDMREEPHAVVTTLGPFDGNRRDVDCEYCSGVMSWHGRHNWYHPGHSREETLEFERNLVRGLEREWVGTKVKLRKNKKTKGRTKFVVQSMKPMESLFKTEKARLLRLPIPDESRPSPETLSLFLALFRNITTLPKHERPWLHFHCKAGRGRTTMAMVLWDLLENGGTLEMATRRMAAFHGGIDLLKPKMKGTREQIVAVVERTVFLRTWEEFARVFRRGWEDGWSAWEGERKWTEKMAETVIPRPDPDYDDTDDHD
jgi:hypothetical protein